MLSPGKHVTRDVPRLVAEAALAFPDTAYRVTDAFGVHEKLAELIALRAGIDVARTVEAADACRCWEPNGQVGRAVRPAPRAPPRVFRSSTRRSQIPISCRYPPTHR